MGGGRPTARRAWTAVGVIALTFAALTLLMGVWLLVAPDMDAEAIPAAGAMLALTAVVTYWGRRALLMRNGPRAAPALVRLADSEERRFRPTAAVWAAGSLLLAFFAAMGVTLALVELDPGIASDDALAVFAILGVAFAAAGWWLRGRFVVTLRADALVYRRPWRATLEVPYASIARADGSKQGAYHALELVGTFPGQRLLFHELMWHRHDIDRMARQLQRQGVRVEAVPSSPPW